MEEKHPAVTEGHGKISRKRIFKKAKSVVASWLTTKVWLSSMALATGLAYASSIFSVDNTMMDSVIPLTVVPLMVLGGPWGAAVALCFLSVLVIRGGVRLHRSRYK
ncbi:hypothetical protein [Nocardiopsis sp. NPDC055824]